MDRNPTTQIPTDKEAEKFFTTPLVIIFVTVFIDLIGFGMVIPILPYYAIPNHSMRRLLRSGFWSASIR